MPTRQDFEHTPSQMIEAARAAGQPSLEVAAGDLHREVGGYPNKKSSHRMPLCCSVMRARMAGGDEILDEPSSGQGTTLKKPGRSPQGHSDRAMTERSETEMPKCLCVGCFADVRLYDCKVAHLNDSGPVLLGHECDGALCAPVFSEAGLYEDVDVLSLMDWRFGNDSRARRPM